MEVETSRSLDSTLREPSPKGPTSMPIEPPSDSIPSPMDSIATADGSIPENMDDTMKNVSESTSSSISEHIEPNKETEGSSGGLSKESETIPSIEPPKSVDTFQSPATNVNAREDPSTEGRSAIEPVGSLEVSLQGSQETDDDKEGEGGAEDEAMDEDTKVLNSPTIESGATEPHGITAQGPIPSSDSAPLRLKIRLKGPSESAAVTQVVQEPKIMLRIKKPEAMKAMEKESGGMILRDKKKVVDRSKLPCVCGNSYDYWGFMVCCDNCGLWCHGTCVGISTQEEAADMQFHCPECEETEGPPKSSSKRRSSRKRAIPNYSEMDEGSTSIGKEIKAAVNFKQILEEKKFSKGNCVKTISGDQFTREFVEKEGLRYPLFIPSSEGLGLSVPPLTVDSVKNVVGATRILDVIETATQAEVTPQWTLGEWVAYYKNPSKSKILNVISLEVSNTKLAETVISPQTVRDIDWIDNVWPRDPTIGYPKVKLYCLMSVEGAYTDFHIDFGGSSVWYHVVRGQKLFMFIPPSEENLLAYEKWSLSPDQNEVFFADLVPKCYLKLLYTGETLIIPTGWIHAVYTPEDSLVFGGNYLHGYNIPLQLKIYEIENRTQVSSKFRFPLYEQMMWYAVQHYVNKLKSSSGQALSFWEYEGVLQLVSTLDTWLGATSGKENVHIPKTIPSPKELLEELSQLVIKLDPPSPISSEELWKKVIKENRKLGTVSPIKDIVHEAILAKEDARKKQPEIHDDDEEADVDIETFEHIELPAKRPRESNFSQNPRPPKKASTEQSSKVKKEKKKSKPKPEKKPPTPKKPSTDPWNAPKSKKALPPTSVRERIAKKLGVRMQRG